MKFTCAVVNAGEDEHGEGEDRRADGADHVSIIAAVLREGNHAAIRHDASFLDHVKNSID